MSHRPFKWGMGANACNPNSWEVEARGARDQGHPKLYNKLKARPEFMPAKKTT